MKLIKSLFVAIMATIVTTIAGSTMTHFFEESKDAQQGLDLLNIFSTRVNAEETMITDDIQDANHTFTTSLNTCTPSTVIDENNLPTPHDESQSPSEKDSAQEAKNELSDYINILANLVPISGEDMDYEKILGISDEQIKELIENDDLNIWEIAESLDEVELLEKAYYAIYPARIIDMLEVEIITQEMADLLIEKANEDIANHQNTSIEVMIENMLTTDLS